jgi:hypothetical protein
MFYIANCPQRAVLDHAKEILMDFLAPEILLISAGSKIALIYL